MWELQVSVLSSSKEALERDVGALMGVHRAPCSTFMPEGSLALLEAGTLQVRYLTLGSSGQRLQRSLLCSEEHPLRHPCLFLAMGMDRRVPCWDQHQKILCPVAREQHLWEQDSAFSCLCLCAVITSTSVADCRLSPQTVQQKHQRGAGGAGAAQQGRGLLQPGAELVWGALISAFYFAAAWKRT